MKLLVALALAAAPAVAFAPHTDPDLVEPTVAPTKDPTPGPTAQPTPSCTTPIGAIWDPQLGACRCPDGEANFGGICDSECHPAATMIQTPTGATRIDELKVGDAVMGPEGQTHVISVVHETKDVIAVSKSSFAARRHLLEAWIMPNSLLDFHTDQRALRQVYHGSRKRVDFCDPHARD